MEYLGLTVKLETALVDLDVGDFCSIIFRCESSVFLSDEAVCL